MEPTTESFVHAFYADEDTFLIASPEGSGETRSILPSVVRCLGLASLVPLPTGVSPLASTDESTVCLRPTAVPTLELEGW